MNGTLEISKKTMVVTGATSGIGLATAKGLAYQGAYVIGVGRSQKRCEQAEIIIRTAVPEARVIFLVADLASQRQVRELAERIRLKAAGLNQGAAPRIDVLINNAGTFSRWFTATPEGIELQLAVNHLAPFLLTHELMPLLKAAPAGRVVTVSSGSHYRTRINWNDIELRNHYNCLRAYKQSKLANVLFSFELNRRLRACVRDSNPNIRAYAVDPGLVNTEIGLKATNGLVRWIWNHRRRSGVDPAAGAATSIYLASEPSVQTAQEVYWKNCRPRRPSRYSEREDAAQRLWEISERMCGINSADYGLG
ncbi:MAG: SDR family oxidoreductase [Firmicutes bacterium]|nr:SDR family oxidoreductase [Bacillota bacterium]